MWTESEFLIDVLGRLNRAGIDAMLTGSMASNYWGIPRSTHDLDFVLLLKAESIWHAECPTKVTGTAISSWVATIH